VNSRTLHELGNGRYRLALGDAGGGQSWLGDVALNRCCGDPLEDTQGFFIYLRDLDAGSLWSATLQPTLAEGANYAMSHAAGSITVSREDQGISLTMDVTVGQDMDAEVRRLSLRNRSGRPRRIELTSYVEVALAPSAADLAHPAFSKLFVQTSLLRRHGAVLASRRPRAVGERWPTLFHAMTGASPSQWETDRARFIGRGRSLAEPAMSMRGTVGNVLDPVLSLRTCVELAPGELREVGFVLGAAHDAAAIAAWLESLGTRPCFGFSRKARRMPRGRMRGGFDPESGAYRMRLPWNGQGLDLPPMPWTNVIANPRFGCMLSETGAGYTWSRNSQANRLTPWSNDPVCDPHGEALYLRDEDSGQFWSPLPGPSPAPATYETHHGFGESGFKLEWSGLRHQTRVFVPAEDPVKVTSLRLTNLGPALRRLSFYAYQRLILGTQPAATGAIRTWRDGAALCAGNAAAGDFSDGIAISCLVAGRSVATEICCDRRSFIGEHGSVRAPAALRAAGLDGAIGEQLDPCFARRLRLDLQPGETVELHLVLGEALGERELEQLLARYGDCASIEQAREQACRNWQETLGALTVHTPVAEIDHLLNGWLPYQALSCRLWGRSAFYQSGGAYGYRDQLQDAGNLCMLRPDLTRRQILLHAAHQFEEGDVLHWWHDAPIERGLRTRFSDDLLWLPYVTAHYLERSGDTAVLDEAVPFLRAPPLAEGQDENYLSPDNGAAASLFEHCCRAIDRSLTRGDHGLPLIGGGDWNDGMNRVGREGRGESVWLGFFLAAVLDAFIPLARQRGERQRARRYASYRGKLAAALQLGGWDGEWFRRAYYDDGTAMGTRDAAECRIDGLAQAWAVLSGAAPPELAAQAMESACRHLVDAEQGLIRLLAPPFVDTAQDPGYIKGYVAGIRENGGQYTHAACWMIAAAARLGWRHRAAQWLTMISPGWHSRDGARRERYKVEPYVIAADIYGAEPHIGRGGWTWYTGAAGWAYRVAVEEVLGLRLEQGRALALKPCIPDDWPGFRIGYRLPGSKTEYLIHVRNPHGCAARIVAATADGTALRVEDGMVRVGIIDDGRRHRLEAMLGA
jgi:cyclic beta-1,2-glucan synthetase